MSKETSSSRTASVTQVLSAGEKVPAVVDQKNADGTLAFLELHDEDFKNSPLTDEEDSRMTKKVLIAVISLVSIINTMLYIDKATLSYASILGLYESTGIGTTEYDDLNSIFYTGYTVGQALNFVLQKVNQRYFLTVTLFVWAILVFCHCAAYNFVGLIFLRLLLGVTESVVVPALEVTMLQFFTPQQRATIQPIFWVSCVGPPNIIAGFIAYGVLYATGTIPPWKIFMIILGGMTLIVTAVCWIWYPADPTTAKFLTTREKYFLIKKVHATSSSSITQTVIKRDQIVECLRDPLSWLFSLAMFLIMLSNNLAYQQNLLYVGLGVSNLGSTLVSVAGAGFSWAYMIFGSVFIYYFPNQSHWATFLGCVPAVASGIAMVTIPWSNKLALLAMLVLAGNTFALAYIVILGWSTAAASGNTKRYVRHLMLMVSYGVSNIISPQLWKGNQGYSDHGTGPRYYAAWTIQIVLSWFGTAVVAFVIHYILKARNKERLAARDDDSVKGVVLVKDPETGKTIEEAVDIANLDLTDLQNKNFIYPL
ncbi:hypothetical protein KL918_005289 [Ogataea parapolymorpha]|uniref:Transporter n=1 Tax=Ogataea parapolymorpha (strain ATCC 26012 / BCRC 20466 / JCM 22074 / NRRL Y-7560 / DL-1) TaxID=871575 RepID=W1QHV5_OGAPD|nr:putative transporter [Ogataea parapolymorpha DL-1]ESX00004.1 putative transporter [Ogataea parapolymorpha DL-1]KAG7864798.1 hypothetical protein KL918_005289 [Ogataea parapolymorpha]KAG7870998.1 hypothetical protein KL916_004549 [Ogataea parapolymorpha]